MIKLFSLKQEKEAAKEASGSGQQKIAPGLIRMQKGAMGGAEGRFRPSPRPTPRPRLRSRVTQMSLLIVLLFADVSELKLEKGLAIDFYNGSEDLMNFKVTVKPDDGIYKGGSFVFDWKVPKSYPHEPPKVLCETTVFHPNIDMEGHVCLNILREDWKPVLTIQSVIMGLQFLMLEPNADDPLNKEVRKSHVCSYAAQRRSSQSPSEPCRLSPGHRHLATIHARNHASVRPSLPCRVAAAGSQHARRRQKALHQHRQGDFQGENDAGAATGNARVCRPPGSHMAS